MSNEKPNHFHAADEAVRTAYQALDKAYSLTLKREEFVTVNIDPLLDSVVAFLQDAIAKVELAREADKEATGKA